MITDQPPKDAIRTEYTATNRKTGAYFVWRRGHQYFWVALGNGGVERSEEAAKAAAKRWIKDSK